MSFLPLLAAIAACAATPEPGEPAEALRIPDEIFLDFSSQEPPASCADEAAELRHRLACERALVEIPVTVAEPVSIAGHIERTDTGHLLVLGRRVRAAFAEIAGGRRAGLVPGTLVRVSGSGAAAGVLEAQRVEILPPAEPQNLARLNREVAEFKEKFWSRHKRYQDGELDAYLAGIVARLAPPYLTERGLRFEVQVVEHPELNAFALPDGTIVLHTGLLDRMQNEAQLASVLAHEMAHITQIHAIRSLSREKEHRLLSWGSLLASLALGASGKGDAAQGVSLMSSAWLSGYSRTFEDEADQVGLRYLFLAGYDVREAPAVWKTFELLYGEEPQEANFFYGSHSTARDRAYYQNHEIALAYAPSRQIGGYLGTDAFLAHLPRMLRASAASHLEKRQYEPALRDVTRSLAIAPEQAETHVVLGQIQLRQGGSGSLEHAIESFRRAVSLDPALASAHRELGLALERLGALAEARSALERYLTLAPDAPDAASIRSRLARI